jgi:hypothetical protein
MSVEVFYVALGYKDDALNYSVESVRRNSPSSPVRIIGDEECRRHLPGELFEYFVPVEPYFERAAKFARVWAHRSPNPVDFELKCMQRWFVAHQYGRRHKVEGFWMLDWDVLVFTDLGQEDIGVGMTCPLFTSYFRNLKWLDCWLQVIEEAFRCRNRLFRRWEGKYLSAEWAAVSDMYLASDLCHGLHILFQPEAGTCWDDNLHQSNGFELENLSGQWGDQMKKLQWIKGQPWAKHLASGQLVRFKSLHCWGPHRGRMAGFLAK